MVHSKFQQPAKPASPTNQTLPKHGRRSKLTTPVALLVLGAAIFGFVRWRSSASDTATPTYRFTTAEIGPVRKTVSATGTLQPWTTVDIKSKAGGRIDVLLVDVGSKVKVGQILAKIDPADSLLTYNQSQADTDAAKAKESQSSTSHQLQIQESEVAVAQADAQLKSARANSDAAFARLRTARDQEGTQPSQTKAAIAQAQANYDSMARQEAQLRASQPQEMASAQASYDQAVASEKNARIYYERVKSLFEQGYVAANDVDQADSAAKVALAQLHAARAKLDSIAGEQTAAMEAMKAKVSQAREQFNSAKAQTDVQSRRNAVKEAEAAYRQAQSQVAQAIAGVQQAQAGRLNNQIRSMDITSARAGTKRAEAALSNAKTTLDQTVVRAPSDGIVLKKYVEQGTIITSGLSMSSTGTSILQLGDVTRMYVNVLVDETDIANVKVGQRVLVSVDAYPDSNFVGKVARIDPQAQVDQNVTSIGVRVEIENSQKKFGLLKPSMNATCDFIIEERAAVLRLPTEAVSRSNGKSTVQVITNQRGSKPQAKDVEVGFQGDDYVEVRSGLKAGDQVVAQTIAKQSTSQQQAAGSPFGGRGPGGPPGGR